MVPVSPFFDAAHVDRGLYLEFNGDVSAIPAHALLAGLPLGKRSRALVTK